MSSDNIMFNHAANGNVAGLKRVVQKERVDEYNAKGSTLLIQATEYGQLRVMEYLIELGAAVDKESRTPYGYAPIHIASLKGYYDCLSFLLKKGSLVNKLSKKKYYTPLICASFSGHVDCCQLLLDSGSWVNSHQSIVDGSTPLFTACQNGQIEIVRLLLSRGALVNTERKTDGSCALHAAAHQGFTEICSILIENGAEINFARKKDGCTPTYLAASAGRIQTLRLFIEKNADINKSRFDNSSSPLFTCAKRGRLECAKILVQAGAYVNQPAYKKSIPITPIVIAISQGHFEICSLLLQHRRDLRFEATYNSASILNICAQQGFFHHLPWLPYAETQILWNNKSLQHLARAKNHLCIFNLLHNESNIMRIASLSKVPLSTLPMSPKSIAHTEKRKRRTNPGSPKMRIWDEGNDDTYDDPSSKRAKYFPTFPALKL